MFRHTICCDEVFIHTIVFNSKYQDKISSLPTRYIDWSGSGASPEILTMNHYQDIIDSKCIFARKFSSVQSKELINRLYGVDIDVKNSNMK